ncbi:prohead protease [Paeniclostridium sordellii]|uniref:prohead protease n=1 Tax=Paraclostridium sordellii TaxID=1505 RepID=UPI00214A669E|nr:prohead protease [Paeniclostridium sordellii]MCR1851148.1 prohead protease [Paeniclostridium sordellii]
MESNIKIDASIIKKKLKNTLSSDNILNLLPNKKVFFIQANNPKQPYVEYEIYYTKPSYYEEGKIKEIRYFIQVDIFSKGDYTQLESIIINEMLNAEFEYSPGSPDLVEKETGLYHKPLRFNIDLPTS